MTAQLLSETKLNLNTTCVIFKDHQYKTTAERGLKPLLSWYYDDRAFLEGAMVADKVIGRAAAMIMIYAGIKEVHGKVMSKAALDVFTAHQTPVSYDRLVDYIINRDGSDLCTTE